MSAKMRQTADKHFSEMPSTGSLHVGLSVNAQPAPHGGIVCLAGGPGFSTHDILYNVTYTADYIHMERTRQESRTMC